MGWLISIAMLVAAIITKNDVLMITSGLFGIAGSVQSIKIRIKQISNDDQKPVS